MLATVAGLVTLILAHRVSDGRRLFLYLCVLVGVIATAMSYIWFNPELRDSLFPRGDSFRFTIWEASLSRLAQSPWFGLGILTEDAVYDGQFWFDHPHNIYIAVAVQGGVVGLALFLWMLLRVVRELLKNLHQMDARLGLAVIGLALSAYVFDGHELLDNCLLYTSPSPRDATLSRMPSSA